MLQAQLFAYRGAHLGAAGFRPENGPFQFQILQQPMPFHFFSHEQRHGGRAPDTGGAEILKKLKMDIQVSRPHRNGECAEFFPAKLEARTRRPQPVAHCHLHAIFRCKPRQLITAGHLQGKGINIIARVGQHLALARGA